MFTADYCVYSGLFTAEGKGEENIDKHDDDDAHHRNKYSGKIPIEFFVTRYKIYMI